MTFSVSSDFGVVLGIDAKYSTPRYSWPSGGTKTQENSAAFVFDPQTGEITSKNTEYDPVKVRLERFAFQSVARKLLKGSKVKRINNCLRVRASSSDCVQVFKSSEHKTCSYNGLQTCASVWACPVCAAKISERRKNELLQAIEQHTANGRNVLLLTLTNPHYLGDKLGDVLLGQKRALEFFNAGKAVTDFNFSIGLLGQVRALEVTHGRLRRVNNGWHPHYHILLFVDSGLSIETLKASYYVRWLAACLKAGLPKPSFEHGIKLDNGSKAAAYASKWGLESEMTKGHIKKSLNGETPFDLLRAVLLDSDKQAAALFREFAETFKGKRQLHWSSGLKSKFQINDISDDVLASQQEHSSFLLGSIELDDWLLILKYDARGEILELARHGWEPVERYLSTLRKLK